MYYRRTQIGWVTILAIGAVLILLSYATARVPRSHAPGAGLLVSLVGLVLVSCMVIFGSMTVMVNDTTVTVQFGPGPIRKTIQLAEIESCRPVRNRWWWGWGIKRIPGGWLYNVSGLGAVELVMKNGRVFRIGTDEPKALAEFIRSKLRRIV